MDIHWTIFALDFIWYGYEKWLVIL